MDVAEHVEARAQRGEPACEGRAADVQAADGAVEDAGGRAVREPGEGGRDAAQRKPSAVMQR